MTRPYISQTLKQSVVARAKGCCEYCLIHQDDSPFTHEVDPFIPLKHGGKTNEANLVLACLECNRYKGTDLATLDQATEIVVLLFNPRLQAWLEHFQLDGAKITGLTAIGRATITLLQMNEPRRLLLRQTLMLAGRYPL